MISFLFWNINKNTNALNAVSRIATARSVDVLLFAECPENDGNWVFQLNKNTGKTYQDLSRIPTKIRLISHLPAASFLPRFTNETGSIGLVELRARSLKSKTTSSQLIPFWSAT